MSLLGPQGELETGDISDLAGGDRSRGGRGAPKAEATTPRTMQGTVERSQGSQRGKPGRLECRG